MIAIVTFQECADFNFGDGSVIFEEYDYIWLCIAEQSWSLIIYTQFETRTW